jgi:hypothetical protein
VPCYVDDMEPLQRSDLFLDIYRAFNISVRDSSDANPEAFMFARRSWVPLHTGSVQPFAPGQEVINPCPGDFILTHGKSWTSRMIRFGQRIRYWGPDKKFTRWNHAAIFINEKGDIIEALGGGVQKRNISVYKQTEYHVVHLQNCGTSESHSRS